MKVEVGRNKTKGGKKRSKGLCLEFEVVKGRRIEKEKRRRIVYEKKGLESFEK